MTASYDKNTAVVVLPTVSGARLEDRQLRAWLIQGDLVRLEDPADWLTRILAEIDRPLPTAGIAAIRMWGQTGERPTAWIAAADPVYLEARLDSLCLHALAETDVSRSELKMLFDYLQRTLGGDSGFGFARLGSHGYLTSQSPIATATLPSFAIDQCVPSEYLPTGDDVARHRNLLSEIEMALHDHDVNIERQAQGKQPVNSLWIWGGGHAAEQQTVPHPALFSDDALLAGYWQSQTGVVDAWPGSIGACLDAAVNGFVAMLPYSEQPVEDTESCLHELRLAMQTKRLNSIVLLFHGGLRAEIRRTHALRVWRRRNWLLDADSGASS